MRLNRKCPGGVLPLATALLLASCQLAPAHVDTTAEAQRLLQADRDFAALADRIGDAEAFYQYLAEDATQIPADAPPRRGRKEISDGLRSLPPMKLRWTPQQASVSDDGSMGWSWGEWSIVGTGKANDAVFAAGRYLDVWKKQADGSWKVVADIGNAQSKK